MTPIISEKHGLPYMQAPPPSEETGLASSPYKYLAVAAVIGAVAGCVFSACLPLAIALIVISAWFLWSGSIILANRAAVGTKLEKPISILHASAMELNAGVVAGCLFPMTLFSSYHKPHGHLKGRPILMVNGYLSFGSTWHYQRRKLEEAGLGPIYTMNFGSGRSIKTYAHYVEEKVKEIQKETGRRDLDLIGHSKGGLVSSYFANYLADETNAEVKNLITIGSPLAGTHVAYLGLGHDAGEMRSNSKFHCELREKMEGNPNTRYFHIGSETDEVVPLTSSLIGKVPSRQLCVKDTGHLGLVFSSRVADQVCSWLKQ
jgi:pimeloyl-ACP methyl ester carboxylesterase